MPEVEITRIGNMDGSYGYSSEVFGFGVGEYDAGLPNLIYDSDTGKMTFSMYQTPYLTFDWNSGNPVVHLGNTSQSVELVTSGLKVGSQGFVGSASSTYDSGDGFWFGYHQTAYKAFIGNRSSGKYMEWDGSDLTVGGTITATGGSIGGWYIASQYLFSADYDVILDSYNKRITIQNILFGSSGIQLEYNAGNPRFYVGNGSSKFMKYENGVLTWSAAQSDIKDDGTLRASDAVISGTLYADAGKIGGWYLASQYLFSEDTDIILDSFTKRITINSLTFGQKGIQLEYNSGNPRFYVGDGSSSGEYLKFDGTNLSWKGANSELKTDGTLHLNNAVLSGTLVSNAGKIAGWNIGGDYLYSDGLEIILDANSTRITIDSLFFGDRGIQMEYNSGNPRFFAGDPSEYFKFDGTNLAWKGTNSSLGLDGILRATGAVISGTLYADAGKIGGWYLSSQYLFSEDSDIVLDSYNKKLTIQGLTFGTSGIQLENNSGSPRFYVGDGGQEFIKYDGTNLSWKGANSELKTDGTLHIQNAVVSGTINALAGYFGNSTNAVEIEPSGLSLGSSGSLRGGKTSYYDDAAGVWLGYDGTAYKFKIGDVSSYLSWDGSTLTVIGDIVANSIDVGTTGYVRGGATDYSTGIGFWLGYDSGAHKVRIGDPNGYLLDWNGTNLTISGTLQASSGFIGGWNINNNTLASDNLILDSLNSRIYSSNYIPGINGAGFSLSPQLLEVNNISARGMIKTAVFEKDTVNVVGGNLMVLDGDVLAQDMTALDASTLIISGTSSFSTNDILRIKDSENDEWFQVTGGSGVTYIVDRDKAGSYGADSNPTWKKGAAIVNYGQSGEGGVLLTASETNAPFVQVFTHAGSPWSAITEKARLGNLTGIGGAVSGTGLWTNNCFLTGSLRTQNNAYSSWSILDEVGFTVNDLNTTNDIACFVGLSDFYTPTIKMYTTSGTAWLSATREYGGLGEPDITNFSLDYKSKLYVGNNTILWAEYDTINTRYIKVGTTSPLNPLAYISSIVDLGTTRPTTTDNKYPSIYGYLSSDNTISNPLKIIGVNGEAYSSSVNSLVDSYYGIYGSVNVKNASSNPFSVGVYGTNNSSMLANNWAAYFDGKTYIQNDLSVSGSFILQPNQTYNLRISGTAPSANRVYTIPDAGGNCEFIMGNGTQSINGAKTFQITSIFQSGFRVDYDLSSYGFRSTTQGASSSNCYIGNGLINVTVSDLRKKDKVNKSLDGLELLKQLEVINFKWKDSYEEKDKKLHIGLAAQQVYGVHECLAKKPENEETGLWATSHDDLFGVLVDAVQQLEKRLTKLEKENKYLKKKLKNA